MLAGWCNNPPLLQVSGLPFRRPLSLKITKYITRTYNLPPPRVKIYYEYIKRYQIFTMHLPSSLSWNRSKKQAASRETTCTPHSTIPLTAKIVTDKQYTQSKPSRKIQRTRTSHSSSSPKHKTGSNTRRENPSVVKFSSLTPLQSQPPPKQAIYHHEISFFNFSFIIQG